jgi:hypothetical protein
MDILPNKRNHMSNCFVIEQLFNIEGDCQPAFVAALRENISQWRRCAASVSRKMLFYLSIFHSR